MRRFGAFALGEHVTWTTRYRVDTKVLEYQIVGDRANLQPFNINNEPGHSSRSLSRGCTGGTMKSVLDIRLRLQELMPSAFYELPPEEAPQGNESAVSLWVAHDENSARGQLEVAPVDDEARDLEIEQSLEEIFEFGAEVDRDRLVQALGGSAGESIRKAVEVRGVDALAWYVTLHVKGLQWGIYVPVTSLVYLAVEVFGRLGTDTETALKIAFRALHQHELFHFATDYLCTQLEAITAEPCHKPGRSLRDQRLGYILLEEELANGHMLRSFRRNPLSLRVAGQTAALRSFVVRQPDGYRDGPRRSSDRALGTGCEELVRAYLSCIPYDPRGFECIDLRGIYPLWPTVDWRHCPVHIIHDEHRLSLPLIEILPFEKVEGVEETTRFTKELERLPRQIVAAWGAVKARLALSTTGHGLDFKLWSREDGDRVYSVRLSRSYRAHLRTSSRRDAGTQLKSGLMARWGTGNEAQTVRGGAAAATATPATCTTSRGSRPSLTGAARC